MNTNEFAAYHEAGHAVATKILGGTVVSMGIKPTPHCQPDIEGLSDDSVATICMAGAAATFVQFGRLGVYETDYVAAAGFASPVLGLARAIILLEKHSAELAGVAEGMIKEIGEDLRYDKVKICVDTVRLVRENGPSVELPA